MCRGVQGSNSTLTTELSSSDVEEVPRESSSEVVFVRLNCDAGERPGLGVYVSSVSLSVSRSQGSHGPSPAMYA